MNRRSAQNLRTRTRSQTGSRVKKRKSEKTEIDLAKKREYERNKKRRQREKKNKGILQKRGPKIKINIKEMTKEARREYERNRKKHQKYAKKMREEEMKKRDDRRETKELNETNEHVLMDEFEEEIEVDGGVNITQNEQEGGSLTGKAILNIIDNSKRKNSNLKYFTEKIRNILHHFAKSEILDILVVLAHSLPDDVKSILKDNGITISSILSNAKRVSFSNIAKSTKFRYKEKIALFMKKSKAGVSADAFIYFFRSVASIWATQRHLLRDIWGIETDNKIICQRNK